MKRRIKYLCLTKENSSLKKKGGGKVANTNTTIC